MQYHMMHNYFDVMDFRNLYQSINNSKEKEWFNYKVIINQISSFLEIEFTEYQNQYIEIERWNHSDYSYKSHSRNYFTIKNMELYEDSQTWPFNFGQYLDKKYSKNKNNDIYDFIRYIDSTYELVFQNNYGINDDYSCKYQIRNDIEDYVTELFFNKGNRWIRKCEIIEKLFQDIRFNYYIFNPSIKRELFENNPDKCTDQLLFVNEKHFTVCKIYFENYIRIDFDVPKNIEHVESGEDKEYFWSAIKVFRIDERIKVYIPKTIQNNVILSSIY